MISPLFLKNDFYFLYQRVQLFGLLYPQSQHKKLLTSSEMVLAHPDPPARPFILLTGASSNLGIGGVFSQADKDDDNVVLRPI